MIKRNPILLIFIPAVVGAFSGNVFNLIPNSPIPFSLFQMGLFISIPTFFAYKLYSSNISFKLNIHVPEALLFLAWFTFSLIYSNNHNEGLFFLIRVLVILFFAYTLYDAIASKEDIISLSKFIVSLSILLALYGIYAMLSNPHEIAQNITATTQGVKNRAIGVENDPNVFASYFIFPYFFLLNMFYSTKKLSNKVLFAGGILVILGAVALTYSRSNMLAMFVGSVIIVFVKKDIKLPILIFIAFVIFTFASETFRLLLFSVIDRMIDLLTGAVDDSNETRILLFWGSIDMVADTYGLGVGLRGFPMYFSTNFDIQETVGVYEPHNMFFQVLAEQGIIGFILFMFLYVRIGLTVWKNYLATKQQILSDISLALFCSFIAFTIFYLLYGGAFTDSRIYIIGVLILALNYHLREPEEPSENNV